MRTFEIVGAAGRRKNPVGWLNYDEIEKTGTIRLAKTAQVGHVPAMFDHYLEMGQRTVDPEWTLKWVQERVPPPSRHNIDEILETLGAAEYDPFQLLFAAEGRSAQDDFYLREVMSSQGGFCREEEKGFQTGECLERAGSAQNGQFSHEMADSSFEYALVQLREDVGADLARARQAAEMTQQDLAYRSGIQQSMLSKLEHGKANPTIETLQCLAQAMGKTLKVSFE